MPSGNGARAQQKRERNIKKAAGEAKAHSQLKSNEAAKSIVCNVCRTSFMCTTKEPELRQHAENKHAGKSFADCFPPA
ncbi:hypothetical protein SAMD00019534_117240 [Acytostelium subglobosum LB1]|uniref:hypothetical protein n=1 Tax=Acytostelium subglobosum LB1 TaxID=1410327 RepID=UPI000645225B|nr:hypothetical protein SAMD00019534_117240 [Acytostelium subglobosum LB1]GAM28548.1 hypothetical protein SAMD00019534_117240 [Acytostelium subglobosum LB1]|eukprot:XP_012748587.1 hypothetical protein SAMD00019534_117240 [Acytostelium subglobosum LB1]